MPKFGDVLKQSFSLKLIYWEIRKTKNKWATDSIEDWRGRGSGEEYPKKVEKGWNKEQKLVNLETNKQKITRDQNTPFGA